MPPSPASAAPLAQRLRFPLLLTAALLIHHFWLWLLIASHRQITLLTLLDHWDGGHYSNIARDGYVAERWAFLPLFPMLERGGAALTGTLPRPQAIGTLLSTVCLVAFVVSVEWRRPVTAGVVGLAPRTRWGWFLLLYTPASFAFHSNHTESLFLLTSFWAFSLAAEPRGVPWGPGRWPASPCGVGSKVWWWRRSPAGWPPSPPRHPERVLTPGALAARQSDAS